MPEDSILSWLALTVGTMWFLWHMVSRALDEIENKKKENRGGGFGEW